MTLDTTTQNLINSYAATSNPVISSSDIALLLANMLKSLFDNLPIFANNSAAITGGLSTGTPYKTSAGVLNIVV